MPLLIRQNTFLAITATPKHFSCHSRYAKTLFLPFPLRQNTFLAIPATPKHFSCHSCYTKTLFLTFPLRQNTIPGHTWSHLVTSGNTWSPPGNTWSHPGNTWSPPTANMRTETATSTVAPPMKFEFPALFSAEPQPTGPVPEINVPNTDPDHHQQFRRDRTRQLGLVRSVTDRLLLLRLPEPPVTPVPPCRARGASRTLEWGGTPQTPPLWRTVHPRLNPLYTKPSPRHTGR